MRLLAKFIVVTLVVAAAPMFLTGVRVAGPGAAAKAAIVYGLMFVFIGWLVTLFVGLLSIVPGILTLGLFFLLVPLIVNTVLLRMTAGMLSGFEIRSWTSAFLLSLLLSLVNYAFTKLQKSEEPKQPKQPREA